MPAYICPGVVFAVKRAGFKVELCDINGSNFDFNTAQLEELCARKNKDIAALIIAHLAGLPLDFDKIKKIAGPYGIFMIEDCAQSLGAVYKGKKAGTLGDAAFFSLARGKGLTIYEGGAVAANDAALSGAIALRINELFHKDYISEIIKILELFGYGIFYRPQLFWFVYSLPRFFWKVIGNKFKAESEYFAADFPVHQVSSFRKFLGHINFSRLDSEISKQRDKAVYYIQRLKDIKGIVLISGSEYCLGTYPFLTLVFEQKSKKDKALKLLENSGLGVSELYTLPVYAYDYLRDSLPAYNDFPGAKYLSSGQIILSTNTFLKKKDADYVIDIIKKI